MIYRDIMADPRVKYELTEQTAEFKYEYIDVALCARVRSKLEEWLRVNLSRGIQLTHAGNAIFAFNVTVDESLHKLSITPETL